jgi:hypothetical protein
MLCTKTFLNWHGLQMILPDTQLVKFPPNPSSLTIHASFLCGDRQPAEGAGKVPEEGGLEEGDTCDGWWCEQDGPAKGCRHEEEEMINNVG